MSKLIVENIMYGPFSHQLADIYLAKSRQKLPVLLVLHDGYFLGGSKNDEEIGYFKNFTKANFHVIYADYISALNEKWPVQVEDVYYLLQFVREHANEYNFDEENVIIAGFESGATIALMAANNWPTQIRKIIAINPITDFSMQTQNETLSLGTLRIIFKLSNKMFDKYLDRMYEMPEEALLGFNLYGNLELARQLSPITQVNPDLPKMLIYQTTPHTLSRSFDTIRYANIVDAQCGYGHVEMYFTTPTNHQYMFLHTRKTTNQILTFLK